MVNHVHNLCDHDAFLHDSRRGCARHDPGREPGAIWWSPQPFVIAFDTMHCSLLPQLPMLASIPILAPFVANPVISKLLGACEVAGIE